MDPNKRHPQEWDCLFTSPTARITTNAAWILFHLAQSDKEIYLSSSYDKLVDFAIQPHLNIRRGLVLSILFDMTMSSHFRTDLLNFCLKGMLDKKESDSSHSMMIKLAAKLCKPHPELVNELVSDKSRVAIP